MLLDKSIVGAVQGLHLVAIIGHRLATVEIGDGRGGEESNELPALVMQPVHVVQIGLDILALLQLDKLQVQLVAGRTVLQVAGGEQQLGNAGFLVLAEPAPGNDGEGIVRQQGRVVRRNDLPLDWGIRMPRATGFAAPAIARDPHTGRQNPPPAILAAFEAIR